MNRQLKDSKYCCQGTNYGQNCYWPEWSQGGGEGRRWAANLMGVKDKLKELTHLLDEVVGTRPFEGSPASAASPITVYEQIVQIQHQCLYVPAYSSAITPEL